MDAMEPYWNMSGSAGAGNATWLTHGSDGSNNNLSNPLGPTRGSTTPAPTHPPMGVNIQMMRFVCEVALNMPIACLGIIGNVLAFVVLCHHKHNISATALLQGLAVSDTLVLLSTILLRCLRYIASDSYQWYVHIYLFRWGFPFVFFFRLTNTWLTVLLTIDRYIAVCHPLRAQHLCNLRRTYISMSIVTVVSALFSIPRFFEYSIYEKEGHGKMYGETSLMRDIWYTILYRIILFFVTMYFIPMILLTVLNGMLLRALRKAKVDRASLIQHAQGKTDHTRSNRSITMIVVAVVLICITCNITAMVSHVLWSLSLCIDGLQYLETLRRYLANVSNVMVTINCAINFVVYCVCSRNFRTVCARTFHCESNSLRCVPRLRKASSSSKRSHSGDTGDTVLLRSLSRDKTHRINSNINHKGLMNGKSVDRPHLF